MESRRIYLFDKVGIPYQGAIFFRERQTGRFYMWFGRTELDPQRKVYIDETAPAMQPTLEDLKEIWEREGELL